MAPSPGRHGRQEASRAGERALPLLRTFFQAGLAGLGTSLAVSAYGHIGRTITSQQPACSTICFAQMCKPWAAANMALAMQSSSFQPW